MRLRKREVSVERACRDWVVSEEVEVGGVLFVNKTSKSLFIGSTGGRSAYGFLKNMFR